MLYVSIAMKAVRSSRHGVIIDCVIVQRGCYGDGGVFGSLDIFGRSDIALELCRVNAGW